MRRMMTSGPAWDESPAEHYPPMSPATGPGVSHEPFGTHPSSRLLRVLLALLLAASAILLAG